MTKLNWLLWSVGEGVFRGTEDKHTLLELPEKTGEGLISVILEKPIERGLPKVISLRLSFYEVKYRFFYYNYSVAQKKIHRKSVPLNGFFIRFLPYKEKGDSPLGAYSFLMAFPSSTNNSESASPTASMMTPVNHPSAASCT